MPIPVTSENWELACLLYRKIERHTDPFIAASIAKIYTKVTSSYSFDSKLSSLRLLITNELDPAFGCWLSEMGYKPKSFALYLESNLSQSTAIDLTLLDDYDLPNYPEANLNGDLDLVLINRGWRLRTYPHLELNDPTLEDFLPLAGTTTYSDAGTLKIFLEVSKRSHTTDTLRNFLKLCKFLSPKATFLASTDRDDFGKLYLPENDLKRKRRQRQQKPIRLQGTNLPDYLKLGLFDGKNTCWACDLPTEEAIAQQQLKERRDLSSSEKSMLDIAHEITHKKNYSQHYCQHHSDVTNRAGNRKALRDRTYFLWLLAALRIQACRIDVDLIRSENWRRFAALALEENKCRIHIHKLSELTPILYHLHFNHLNVKALANNICYYLTEIYKILGLTREQAFTDNMPCLKDRKIKTPRKSRLLKLRASVPPTAPAP